MAINIKNEQVVALAREASRLTGQTQVGAIEQALRQLVSQQDAAPAGARADLVWGTLALVDAQLDQSCRDAMQRVTDEMYDDAGLPA